MYHIMLDFRFSFHMFLVTYVRLRLLKIILFSVLQYLRYIFFNLRLFLFLCCSVLLQKHLLSNL